MKRMIESWTAPWGETFTDVQVQHGQYQNGTLAVQLTSDIGEPLVTVSVNLEAYGLYPEGTAAIFVKDYSEGEGLLDSLVDAGLLEETGRTVTFGPYGTTAREARVL